MGDDRLRRDAPEASEGRVDRGAVAGRPAGRHQARHADHPQPPLPLNTVHSSHEHRSYYFGLKNVSFLSSHWLSTHEKFQELYCLSLTSLFFATTYER